MLLQTRPGRFADRIIRILLAALAFAVTGTALAGATFQDIGALPGAIPSTLRPTGSSSLRVSKDGTVVLGVHVTEADQGASRPHRPFLWTAAGGEQALPLPDGVTSAIATLLSANGQVVGGEYIDAQGDHLPCRWTSSGISALGDSGLIAGAVRRTMRVTDMSDDGSVIVGVVAYEMADGPEEARPFRWNSSSGDLQVLPAPQDVDYTYPVVRSVRVSGDGTTLCGEASIQLSFGDISRAFRWKAGAYQTLGLQPDFDYSTPTVISQDGSVIAGLLWHGLTNPVYRAVRWVDGVPGAIPDVFGVPALTPVLMSDNGNVVALMRGLPDFLYDSFDGTESDDIHEGKAYLWKASTPGAPIALPTPVGYPDAMPTAMSDDGSVVVGECQTTFVQGERRWSRAVKWSGSPATVTVLPALPGMDEYNVYATNSDGTVVVGNHAMDSDGAGQLLLTTACRWVGGTIESIAAGPDLPLGGTEGRALSENGLAIVGISGDDTFGQAFMRPFLWTKAGGLRRISVPPSYGSAEASLTSADGARAVVHFTDSQGGGSAAFVYDAATAGLTALGNLPGKNATIATHVSANGGVVAGTSYTDGTQWNSERAFRWTSGGMQDLGLLAGMQTAKVKAMSSDGSVIFGDNEFASDTAYKSRAFRWSAGTLTSLALPSGSTDAQLLVANRSGTAAVGICWNANTDAPDRLFRWKNGVATAITVPVPPTGASQDGLVVAMSDDGDCFVGWIVVTDDSSGVTTLKAMRWTPTTGLVQIGEFTPTSMTADGLVVAGTTALPNNSDAGADAVIWTTKSGGTVSTLKSLLQAQGVDTSTLHPNSAYVNPTGSSIAGSHSQLSGQWGQSYDRRGIFLVQNLSLVTPPAPTITAVTPSSGSVLGGTDITITGTNLATTTSVTVDGVAATSVVAGATSVTAKTPAGTAGAKNVVITTAGGTVTRTNAFTYVATPSVLAISPIAGPLSGGTLITMTGTNLTGATVKVGGNAATGVTATATTITATTPAGSAGAKDVVVTTVGGSFTLPGAFSYLNAPTLTSVSPGFGPLAGGTSITITGTNLSAATVKVGGVAASGVVATASSITANTPAGSMGARDVSVTTAGGTATKAGAFTYLASPTIAAVTPASGPSLGGTTVTVTGANLLGASMTVGGVPASILSTTATSISATTPAGTAGARDVRVTTVSGTATKTGGFTYVDAPIVASVTPAAGPLAGGTTLTVTGSNLAGATVKVGGVSATAVVATASSLTAKTPAGTVGAKDVTVTTVGGSASSAGAFTYVAAPTIATVSPTSGPQAGGTSITVTGTNLSGATLKVGGVTATGVISSDNSLTGTTSASVTAGAKIVEVSTAGGTATKAGAFTYLPTPTITTITPSSGPVAGGTSISIIGTNLTGASLTIGGVAATNVVATATGITAKTPAGTEGAKPVVVTTSGGTATKATGFTYMSLPTLTDVSPVSGPVAGGTTITITGTNLSGALVQVGGVNALVTATSATSITARTPAGTAGAKNVLITTAGGSVTGTGAFTYVALPTITAVSPPSGPLGGGTTITITGTNLSGASVKVDGVAATGVVASATSVTATTPARTAGAKTVAVTTAGGSASKPAAFTYVAAPTVTSVTPSSGPAAGGTSIVIAGTNLLGSTVTVGGSPATSVVATATSISARTPAGSAGAKDVVVTAPGGSVTKANGFTFIPAPTISSVSPGSGPLAGGTTITITGTGLSGATVKVGGVAAVVSATSATSVTAKTPAGSAGAKDVLVTAAGGTATSAGAFTYVAAPTITTVSPASGPIGGGTSIVINGTNLSGAAVTVGGSAATVISTSASSLTATTPAGTLGAKAVVVSTAGGTATKPNAFTYTASLTGGPGSMPSIGGPGALGGPSGPPDPGADPLPITLERCIALIQQSTAPAPECDGTACEPLQSVAVDPVTDGPQGPDLDGNGVPDLCQLRCGDLDLNGRVDAGDVAIMLSLMGEQSTLGIGDFDGDGTIGETDLVELLGRMPSQSGDGAPTGGSAGS